MKKILSIFLCLIFICSIVSCTSQGDESTSAVSENGNKSTQQSSADYKRAYLEFLKDKQESHRLFALVFIDNDDIPELYLKG